MANYIIGEYYTISGVKNWERKYENKKLGNVLNFRDYSIKNVGFNHIKEAQYHKVHHPRKYTTSLIEKDVYYDLPIIVQVIAKDKAIDILTETEFEIVCDDNQYAQDKVLFNLGDVTPLAHKNVADHLKKLSKDDIEVYKVKMEIFNSEIEKENRYLRRRDKENIQFIKKFKERYNDK